MLESTFKNANANIYLFVFPTVVHKCSECDATYGQISSLFRHIRTVHKAAGGFTCQECNYRATRKDNLRRHVKSKHSDVKASTASRAPVPNIINPGNDISAWDTELMELTHDVAFSQYSHLLQISNDEQPPIKKSAKPKISEDTFNCTDCEVQTSSKFKLNGHQKRKHPTPRTNQRCHGQQDLLTNHLFQDAQPSGSRQPQSPQQQQLEDEEFEDFFSDHPKPWANNEHLKEDYREHFIGMFGGNQKPWTGDDQLKKVYQRHFDQIKNQDLHRRHTRTYNHFLDVRRYNLLEAMENVIDQVFCRQSQAFKINISFS